MKTYSLTEKTKNIDLKQSGIYLIKGLVETEQWKIYPMYIGSAKKLKIRLNSHFGMLKRNCHHNQFLQNYYNKYGIENLEVDILEICSLKDTIKIEQKYLDIFKPFAINKNGFNVAFIAEASQRGAKWTKETRKKWKKIRKKPDVKAKYDAAYNSFKKEFTLISPEGEIITGRGLNQFAIKNNLSVQDLSKLTKGKIPSVKGWRLTPKPEFHKTSEKFKIINPEGEIIEACNITKFAKKVGINYTSLRHVIRGYKNEFKGWKHYEKNEN